MFSPFNNKCMHADEDKLMISLTCKGSSQSKKSINLKLCVQIKLQLHQYFFYDKIFKTRHHLLMFVWFFNTK